MIAYILRCDIGFAHGSQSANSLFERVDESAPDAERGLWCLAHTGGQVRELFFRGNTINSIIASGRGWYIITPKRGLGVDVVVQKVNAAEVTKLGISSPYALPIKVPQSIMAQLSQDEPDKVELSDAPPRGIRYAAYPSTKDEQVDAPIQGEAIIRGLI